MCYWFVENFKILTVSLDHMTKYIVCSCSQNDTEYLTSPSVLWRDNAMIKVWKMKTLNLQDLVLIFWIFNTVLHRRVHLAECRSPPCVSADKLMLLLITCGQCWPVERSEESADNGDVKHSSLKKNKKIFQKLWIKCFLSISHKFAQKMLSFGMQY